MGIGGAVLSHKGKDKTFIKLYRLTGSQVFGQKNHRLITGNSSCHFPLQNSDYPVRDIPDIRSTLLHVGIIHGGKHLGEIITGGCHGKFGIDFLGLNHIHNRFYIIQII